MAGARGSPLNRQRLEQIAREVLESKDSRVPHGNGERFALEAARRAVQEAYGHSQKAAAGDDGKDHGEGIPAS